MNYFGIQLQESTKAQIISEDNVKTWLIFNFRCFAPLPGILLFNYLLHVCIYSLICIPPFIFRTFSGLNYFFFFFSKYLWEIGDSVPPCSILHCLELAIAPAQKKPHCIILLPISPTALLPSYDFSFPLDMPSFIY